MFLLVFIFSFLSFEINAKKCKLQKYPDYGNNVDENLFFFFELLFFHVFFDYVTKNQNLMSEIRDFIYIFSVISLINN